MSEILQMYRLSDASQQAYKSELQRDEREYGDTNRGMYDKLMLEMIELGEKASKDPSFLPECEAQQAELRQQMGELQQEDPSCTAGTQFDFKCEWIPVSSNPYPYE